MSLNHEIAVAVADWQAQGAQPGLLTATASPCYRLEVDVLGFGPNGLSCHNLRFQGDDRDPDGWTIDQLRSWGDRFADRVTYLLEPLCVVECDPDQGVQVRSQQPTPSNGVSSYYEALLRADGSLTLHRVTFADDQRTRQTAPCHLTLEVIQRLADDIVAAHEDELDAIDAAKAQTTTPGS